MYCKNCGNFMENGSVYCSKCGAQAETGMPLKILSPCQEMLKKLCSTATYTSVCVSYTLIIFLSILVSAVAGLAGSEMLLTQSRLMLSNGDIEFLEAIAVFLPVIAVVAMACFCIPAVINAIALWMIRKNTGSKKQPLKTTGFTVLLVMNIIGFVFYCIEVVFSVVQLILYATVGTAGALYFFSGEYVNSAATSLGVTAVVAMTLFAIVCYAIGFVYYIKVFKTLNVARRIVKTGESVKKPSVFVAIMFILCGITYVLGATASMVFIIPIGGILKITPFVMCVMALLICVLSAIFSFGVAMLIFNARKRMEEIKNPVVHIKTPKPESCEETVEATDTNV